MESYTKILIVILVAVVGFGSLATYFFTQGSIIGDSSTSKLCEWTVTRTEDIDNFTDYGELNSSLKDILGDNWKKFYSENQVRKNPETGVIEDRINGTCSFTGSIDAGGSE